MVVMFIGTSSCCRDSVVHSAADSNDMTFHDVARKTLFLV